jgi:chromosome partitioning protein
VAEVVAETGNQVSSEIDMQRIQALAARAEGMVSQVRDRLLAPESRKASPTFSTSQLAALCGVDKAHVNYRVGKGDLPVGKLTPTGARREFDLSEIRQWARSYRSAQMRPSGRRAMCIAVANFKGGVSKTTTAMVLAQGLSMRGHRVLAIDVDPQGSLTTLHGVLPETDVTEEMTIAPLCHGVADDIRSAIRSTYWDGIDLVAAAPFLFGAEFVLPSRQLRDGSTRFWTVLSDALESVRDIYDVIVIDTPPSLSYVTINALWAADGIIVPTQLSGLDFASSAQFWGLLADLGANLDEQADHANRKRFEFLHVLLARVDSMDAAAPAIRQWIQATYGEHVLPIEIPRTTVTTNKSAEFATVYDVQRYDGSAKAYRRAVEAYDRLVELVEQSVVAAWRKPLRA